MKKAIAATFLLFVLATLTPSTPAIQVHLDAPDPGRGLIGVRVVFRMHGRVARSTANTVYFVRAEEAADGPDAESVIVSNYWKGENVYLLNAEPGRYVAIGAELLIPGVATHGVVVFAESDIPKTEVEVKAGSVVFMGEIAGSSSITAHELDGAQARSLNIINANSKKLGLLDRMIPMNYAYPGTIRSVERGEATDSEFWNSASFNHFKSEPAWKSRVMGRPILPVAGAAKPKPAPGR